MFQVARHGLQRSRALSLFIFCLEVLCGLAAVGFTQALYWVEDSV